MLTQYLLAPLLWSFWLLSLGLPHPLREPLAGLWGGLAIPALFTIFVASEILNMAIGIWAVRRTGHRGLWAWAPTMHLYFPLGCLAAWKALYEVVVNPFYWDKTRHGVDCTEEEPVAEPSAALVPVVSFGTRTGEAASEETEARSDPAHAARVADQLPPLSLPVRGTVS